MLNHDHTGEFFEVFFEEGAVTHHYPHPVHGRGLPPAFKGRGGGGDGIIDDVGSAHRDVGDDFTGGGVVDGGGFGGLGNGPGPVDQDGAGCE